LKDYYQILTVPPTATQPEIRKAFYKLAKQFHPDKNPDAAHHHKFLEINEAYETLGDKEKRAIYHYRWVNFQRQPKTTATGPRPAPQRPAQPFTGRPQSRYRPPQPPPYFRQHYQNYSGRSFQEYEPVLRRVCQMVLVLSFLLIADKFLAHPLPNQTITRVELPSLNAGSESAAYISTRQVRFRVNFRDFENMLFTAGQQVTLWRTPIFSQITHVSAGQEKYGVNKGTVYHNFFLLLLMQSAAAATGLRKNLRWSARLNAGIIAGCFGVITLILLYMGF